MLRDLHSPTAEILDTTNLFAHPMVSYIMCNIVIYQLSFPGIKYIFNEPLRYRLFSGPDMSYNYYVFPLSFAIYLFIEILI